jgi:hypothetical protein
MSEHGPGKIHETGVLKAEKRVYGESWDEFFDYEITKHVSPTKFMLVDKVVASEKFKTLDTERRDMVLKNFLYELQRKNNQESIGEGAILVLNHNFPFVIRNQADRSGVDWERGVMSGLGWTEFPVEKEENTGFFLGPVDQNLSLLGEVEINSRIQKIGTYLESNFDIYLGGGLNKPKFK